MPLRFLIPGDLDYYDFTLRQKGVSGRIVNFEITVNNWLLGLFAPTLHLKYDQRARRLVWYQGLSNISDEKGRIQTVTITYKYP